MSPGDRLYLVRHGEAAASWGEDADPPLSEQGSAEAVAAKDRLFALLDGQPGQLVSSPLLRAQQTALPLADVCMATPAIDEAFREVPAPVPLPERQRWLRAFMQQRWDEQDESLLAWRDRIFASLDALPCNSVVFTHFLVINAIVGRLQHREETLVFWPANASITILEKTADGWAVAELGESMRSIVN